jgi:hypothetical protein
MIRGIKSSEILFYRVIKIYSMAHQSNLDFNCVHRSYLKVTTFYVDF